MACNVVAHTEVRAPKLAWAMWKDRRGCFQKPKKGQNPTVSLYDEIVLLKAYTYTTPYTDQGSARS